ncbi:MAG: hypothetical protein R3353_03985 [Salegentibacter mishustinae]|nr:hypothetical protein [Salegentibacter mishustinae]
MVGALASLVFAIGLVSLLVLLQGSPLLDYIFSDGLVKANSFTEVDAGLFPSALGRVNNDPSSGLKDMWSSQTVFYQTIITFLIAINGLIAAVSVFYIKSNSEEKAEEITKKYMSGEGFNINLIKKVKMESESVFKQAQDDFDTSANKLNDALATLDKLTIDNISLKQQLKVISERIASLDTADTEGKNFILNRRVR